MINFGNVENSVRILKKQVATNQIDDKVFEDRLLELIDIAEDGCYWMYGHESERWFRHDGQKWVPDDPDRILALRAQTDSNTDIGQDPVEEIPVNWTWFTVSLASLAIIGGIVYVSSMA
jgi:hypothetical protein